MKPADLARELFERHRIWTVAIDRPEASVHGVRVTPHVYTTRGELDTLVRALGTLAA
jgi:selenocysteine lyase/cysteine desulfurase